MAWTTAELVVRMVASINFGRNDRQLCRTTRGSLISLVLEFEPNHLSDQNVDHGYFFELSHFDEAAGCPIKLAMIFTSHHRRLRALATRFSRRMAFDPATLRLTELNSLAIGLFCRADDDIQDGSEPEEL